MVCVSRCLVGDDFWFMGGRCDVRMTRLKLVGACLGALVAAVTVVIALAMIAVRRYRAVLIQAKVDQTRSRYTRIYTHTHTHTQEVSKQEVALSILMPERRN